jgi:hypothetical protein
MRRAFARLTGLTAVWVDRPALQARRHSVGSDFTVRGAATAWQSYDGPDNTVPASVGVGAICAVGLGHVDYARVARRSGRSESAAPRSAPGRTWRVFMTGLRHHLAVAARALSVSSRDRTHSRTGSADVARGALVFDVTWRSGASRSDQLAPAPMTAWTGGVIRTCSWWVDIPGSRMPLGEPRLDLPPSLQWLRAQRRFDRRAVSPTSVPITVAGELADRGGRHAGARR